MSVQFGRWNFDGRPSTPDFLEKVAALLLPYGPDAFGSHAAGGLSFVHRALRTSSECRSERQPYRLPCGVIFTWDGRLDNRDELIRALRGGPAQGTSDAAIAAAAYDRWQNGCFRRLLGDWALAAWNPQEVTLTLAKDFCGVRPLYYTIDKAAVTWSSLLSAVIELSGCRFILDEEYLASWIVAHPSASRTPYSSVHAVPPASYVLIQNGNAVTRTYWEFDPEKRISYKTDARYEEHFLAAFSEAVRRRLRSDSPVLAELSGGMDSSSIVCVADRLLAEGAAETRALHTVSYYSDAEPNWDERPYFQKVEAQRRQTGCHINVSTEPSFPEEYPCGRIVFSPDGYRLRTAAAERFAELLTSYNHRVLLSGLGGDEVLGGAPSPSIELADLLATGHLRRFFRQMVRWALLDRTPIFQLMAETVTLFLPPALGGLRHPNPLPTWFETNFTRGHRLATQQPRPRFYVFGHLPSFQNNLETLEALRSQIAHSVLPSEPPYEKRYPFLDRDLLEFLYAVPRSQLLRPGQRRSLMRRALVGIVPEEVLNRRRKAFVVRSPMIDLSSNWMRLSELASDMVSARLGIVNAQKFHEVLRCAHEGQEIHLVHVLRTLSLEYWLRHLRDAAGLTVPSASRVQSVLSQVLVDPATTLRGVR